jgi:hypothetical protein
VRRTKKVRLAPVYLERIWAERMKGLFDRDQEEVVLRWLSENWKRDRVVVVGSGFSKNAARPKGTAVPLWSDLSMAIARDLGVPEGTFDALHLPDLHAAQHGGSRKRLRDLMGRELNDALLRPGQAHDALWVSNPAAVITTNFLDTLLEKSRPRRAQNVVTDMDLGLPLASEHRHLLYFHGHRLQPTTWVASRQEYEALPAKRPLVHAKVRQLLAEYPALIVGYSLSDPDFHLIYGDTWRAMGKSRPKGLALLPTSPLAPSRKRATAEKLTQKYWETLGLSFVKFSSTIVPDKVDEAYARFFKLTEHVATVSQLLMSLEKPAAVAGSAAAFERNTTVGSAAFDDDELAEVFRFPDNRVRWWRDVIAHSLDETGRTNAKEASRRTNLLEHAKYSQVGETRRAASAGTSIEPAPLAREAWVAGRVAWRRSQAVETLLTLLEGGNETTRQLEQLLLAGAKRASVRGWLTRALTDPEFVPRVVESSYVVALALLADGDQTLLRDAYHVASSHSEGEVAAALSTYLRRVPPKRRLSGVKAMSRLLAAAFEAFAEGDLPGASKIYAAQYEQLLLSSSDDKKSENNILAYFAAQGVLDCTTWRTDLAVTEDLQRKRDVLAQLPTVRRWRDRTRALSNEVTKTKAKRARHEGYEHHGGSWSASPGELWYHFERAKALGAPLSIRRELLAPLLDTIPDAEEELRERLANCVKDTGDWLRAAFQGGAFAVNRGALLTEAPPLTREKREAAASAVSRQLLPTETLSRMAREARLELLGDFPDVVRFVDLPRIATLLRGSVDDSDQMTAALKALASVSHVCSWSRLSKLFIKVAADADMSKELSWTQRALPWEHWAECDQFWDRGGLELLRALTRVTQPMIASQVGERLWWLLDFAPKREIQRLAGSWLRTASKTLSDNGVLRVAAGLLTSFPSLGSTATARKVIRAARKKPGIALLGVIVRAASGRGIEPPTWANAAIEAWVDRKGWRSSKNRRTLGPGSYVAEARCLVSIVKSSPKRHRVCVDRLLQLTDSTWSVLPELASILRPEFWGSRWPALLRLLRVGGHARQSKSWLVQRVRLVAEVLSSDATNRSHFMQSDDLAFLRSAVIDGIAHGDANLANHAVYLLPFLARFGVNESERSAVAFALTSAADDIRIGVAHGAAFSAAYIIESARHEPVSTDLLAEAHKVRAKLTNDSLAVVRRQLEFGRAKAIRHFEEAAKPKLAGERRGL